MRISDWSSDVCSSDLDVALLVEARPQLDQRGDRLARLGRLAQRLDDGRVLRGAIERLLDGDDRRIVGRLAQELHHHVEALVGMVDDEVLGADRREAVAAEVADALRKRSEEHTSELQSLMRISYAVFSLTKNN